MTFGKTILWSALSVVGVSAILAPAQAVPVVPNFTQGLNDEPHGDDLKGNRNNQFNGLQYWISIFSNWFRNNSIR